MSAVSSLSATPTPQPWGFAERALLAYAWRQMRSTRGRAVFTWLTTSLVLGCLALLLAMRLAAPWPIQPGSLADTLQLIFWGSMVPIFGLLGVWMVLQTTLLKVCNQLNLLLAPGVSSAGRNIAVIVAWLFAALAAAAFGLSLPIDASTATWVFVLSLLMLALMLLIFSQPKQWYISVFFMLGPTSFYKMSAKYPAINERLDENSVAILMGFALGVVVLLWFTASAAYGCSGRIKESASVKQKLRILPKTGGLSDPALWRMPQMWGKWFSVSHCYNWLLARALRQVAAKPKLAVTELLPFSLTPAGHWVNYAWMNVIMMIAIALYAWFIDIRMVRYNMNAAYLVIFSYSAFAGSLSMLPVAICSAQAEQRLLWLMPNTTALRNGNGLLLRLIRTILLRSFLLGVGMFAALAWTLEVPLDKSLMALVITAGTTFIVVGRNARDYAHNQPVVGYSWLVLEPMLYGLAMLLFSYYFQARPALLWAVLGASALLAACWMAWRLHRLANYAPAFPVGRLAS